MDCVCVPFRGWMGKTTDLSSFEQGMVVGARHTGLCQEQQRCWVFHAQQFPMCIKNGPLPKGHPANTIVGSIGVNMNQYPLEHLTPCRDHSSTNSGCSEGKREFNSILGKVFLMFAILSLCFELA